MTSHDRRYTILLGVLCGLFVLAALQMEVLMVRLVARDGKDPAVFHYVAAIVGAYAAATLVTFVLRVRQAPSAPIVTRVVNILLLFYFPFGTALGIYGLLKVDRVVPTSLDVFD